MDYCIKHCIFLSRLWICKHLTGLGNFVGKKQGLRRQQGRMCGRPSASYQGRGKALGAVLQPLGTDCNLILCLVIVMLWLIEGCIVVYYRVTNLVVGWKEVCMSGVFEIMDWGNVRAPYSVEPCTIGCPKRLTPWNIMVYFNIKIHARLLWLLQAMDRGAPILWGRLFKRGKTEKLADKPI